MTDIKVYKGIKLLVAFSIFWMVIGDLIIYHQEVMFGVKLFEEQHPFTKPKSQDDGKIISFKSHKGADKSDYGQASLLHAVLSVNDDLTVRHFFAFTYLHLTHNYESNHRSSDNGLRAPPLI
jgi:hypothetical protein